MTNGTTDHPRRQFEQEGDDRRWVTNRGGNIPDHPSVQRLLKHGCDHHRRWNRAANAIDDNLDQIQTENLLWSLVDAGLVRVHERRTKRGDWEPYEWTATERGENQISKNDDSAALSDEVARFLSTVPESRDEVAHPAAEIRRWLQSGDFDDSPRVARIAMALGRQLRRGHRPTARAVSIAAFGDSKTLQIDQCREQLEEITGRDIEQLFKIRGRAVYTWGAFDFHIRGRRITGDWSIPWLALTADTIDALYDLQVQARRIVTVENLATFESFVREERPEETVTVFTSGFPGSLQMQFLEMLIDTGVDQIHHWGDLDAGGLQILQHLSDSMPADVQPFRMEPAMLDELPTRPLTNEDRKRLQAWPQKSQSRFAPLAQALLEADAKLEQEAWYLVHGAR